MSRIGNRALKVPAGVKVTIGDLSIIIENDKNRLEIKYNKFLVKPQLENDVFKTKNVNNSKQAKSQFGTINALANNAFIGLTNPFTKRLEIVGVGYKATMVESKLRLDLGYSHPIFLEIPEDIQIKLISSLEIELSSYNKASLGSFAAKIRGFRPPEPYKGKGVKYKDEIIVRKVGKTSEGTKK